MEKTTKKDIIKTIKDALSHIYNTTTNLDSTFWYDQDYKNIFNKSEKQVLSLYTKSKLAYILATVQRIKV